MRSFKRGYFYFRIPAHPLITCTALHWFPPKIVSSEKPLKQHVVCQTSDEPQLKPMLMRFFQVGWQCLKAE